MDRVKMQSSVSKGSTLLISMKVRLLLYPLETWECDMAKG